jgi:hypothetical protein
MAILLEQNAARGRAHDHTVPDAELPRAALRNNHADPTNSMTKNAFSPNPRHTPAAEEVTKGGRTSAIAKTNASASAVANKARVMPCGRKRAATEQMTPTTGTTKYSLASGLTPSTIWTK